jgi:TatD DNase family protein
VDPEDWKRQAELVEKYPGVFVPVLGIHPWRVHALETREGLLAELDQLKVALTEDWTRVGGVGETGIDGARKRLSRSRALQLEAFEAQLGLAREMKRPLVLHIVQAHSLALEVLRKPEFQGLQGMIHSFSGTQADARAYLELGWLLSFSAGFLRPEAEELRKVLRNCPADRLIFETDAPDQAPPGSPTLLHTPVSLLKVVEEASHLRSENAETLLERSRDNLAEVFN